MGMTDADPDPDSNSDATTDPSPEVPVPTLFHIDHTTAPASAPLAWIDARSITMQFRELDLVVTGIVHRAPNLSYEKVAIEFSFYSAEGEVLACYEDYGLDCETARGCVLPFRRTFTAGPEALRRGTRVEIRVATKAFDVTPPVCATVVHT